MEVPSELSLPPSSYLSGSGLFFLVGELTDLCIPSLTFRAFNGDAGEPRFFGGDSFRPRSEELRRCPFEREVFGCSLILILLSRSLFSFLSSSVIVSTVTGRTWFGLRPAFWSVRGGLGGGWLAAGDLVCASLSFDALTSVAGGVKMLIGGPGRTASLLCCLEKDGYGRLDLDSDLSTGCSSSSEIMPGIDDRRGESLESTDVLEVDFSFDDTLR